MTRVLIDKRAVQLRTRRRLPWFWLKDRQYGPSRDAVFTVTDEQTGIPVPLYERRTGQRCVRNPYIARDGRLRVWVNAPVQLAIEVAGEGIAPAVLKLYVPAP